MALLAARRVIAAAFLPIGLQGLEILTTGGPAPFTPTQGGVGMMAATRTGSAEVCNKNSYEPSALESAFKANVIKWTDNQEELCKHLKERHKWVQQLHNSTESPGPLFSKMCKKGEPPQFIEPLAGILRDPRFPCDAKDEFHVFSIEWLLLGDSTLRQNKKGKNILFDAGGTRFRDAMRFFTNAYQKRGIAFDEIHVWEATKNPDGFYWKDIPEDVRKAWEPRIHYYNGVPVTTERGHNDNPVDRIFKTCKPDDFCAFKLDIDTPSVELPIVEQLLSSPQTGAYLDEFFFEHHVKTKSRMRFYWPTANGTYADSYDIFTKLREKGVRAHSWI